MKTQDMKYCPKCGKELLKRVDRADCERIVMIHCKKCNSSYTPDMELKESW